MIDNEEIEVWEKYINQGGCEKNLDLVYAKKTFFNVSKQAVLASFNRNVIERADELRFMPNILFNKYFYFFTDFIINQKHDEFDAGEIASCFTSLLNEKLDAKAIECKDLHQTVINAVKFLQDHIEFYNTDADIYGDLDSKLLLLQNKLSLYKV
ncbi:MULTISPECIES: hypothetical protein [unclassified Pseudoalteromonas]|uniref:hypothetical protein n=1 Tax=unclassified Pseudoalteromonas TaxID=194690 RepID=UPI000AA11D78|nr:MULTISPECIES: hypothetical protein [unclassified Pseudoalteromonas]